ncbi:hypothetical protein BGW36DRAFT_378342 [Talaromyces proteolyticus]|uniref:MYND-type domain-containing protein n=1 Tax=Talaromyces proteolyticus TaxID=1131652 RepID=A0AAD4KP29_9EURO|nr:uncharacterized protein BGW36DRAFT_378342 [Talaromyces proteolyticus]KAH8697267.1 hypothetical protein BGW36DRAFT_378342 [Talaromyces proteolyticus]
MDIINNKLAMLANSTSALRNPSSRICTNCKKREPPNADPDQKLKRCARCRNRLYCSRACQRVDWKSGHQRACRPLSISLSKPIQTVEKKSCLAGLAEDDAMDQLIDAYRLRVEDEKTYRGTLRGRYAEGEDGAVVRDFQRFLDLAEARRELDRNGEERVLPDWWDVQKREECESRAMQSQAWSTLWRAVSKNDILEHYRDSAMPMKLRMLAEAVYGYNVMDQSR